MSPFRKFHVLQRVTATAASPNTLEFMRKNQHLRLGEMRFWQIFTSFPPPLPFSISPGKFHSSLPHTSSGNPMLPFLMELWVRSKWGNWERDGLVWNSGADNCMRTHSVARAMIVEEKWHLNSKIKCGQDNFNAILQVSPKYLSSSMLILPWGMGWWSSTYPEKVLLQRGGHDEPLTGSQSPHAEVVHVIPACISLTNAKSMPLSSTGYALPSYRQA